MEVSVTVLPSQKVDGPAGVIVGVAGIGFIVTVVAVEAALLQLRAVTVLV